MSDDQRIVIDDEFDLPGISPVCSRCKHLRSFGGRTCAAFPDGIPSVIWRGDNDHRKPHPGDHGIQFEPVEEER